MRSLLAHLNHYKKIYFFFSSSIRMNGKNINFGDKKNKKKRLLQKQKSSQDR